MVVPSGFVFYIGLLDRFSLKSFQGVEVLLLIPAIFPEHVPQKIMLSLERLFPLPGFDPFSVSVSLPISHPLIVVVICSA